MSEATASTASNPMDGLIDAHCHLADARFDGTRAEIETRARDAGIHHFIQGGVGPDDWSRQIKLGNHTWFLCFGLHPWYVGTHGEDACAEALALLPEFLPKAVALGELGLDHGPRCQNESYARQERYFLKQLEIAVNQGLPLVLHVVRAHGKAIEILKGTGQAWRGIVHGFTGNRQIAEAYLGMGLSISIGGAITRPGYEKLKQAIAYFPKDRLVVESAAPDMAPAEFDRTLNEPVSLWRTATAAGLLQKRSAEEILRQSAANLRDIFHLESSP